MVVEQTAGIAYRVFKATAAEVIVATLGQARPKRDRQHLQQKRDILVDELLLEGDGIGADDHFLFGLAGKVDCGDQIGETLADSGSRLDGQMMGISKGLLDGQSHLNLLRTRLVFTERFGQGTFGTEDLPEIQGFIVVGRRNQGAAFAAEPSIPRAFCMATTAGSPGK